MEPTGSPVTVAVRRVLGAERISQTRVAEVLGITQVAVSTRVRGDVGWRADELVAISQAFGLPLHQLYGQPEPSGPAVAVA